MSTSILDANYVHFNRERDEAPGTGFVRLQYVLYLEVGSLELQWLWTKACRIGLRTA